MDFLGKKTGTVMNNGLPLADSQRFGGSSGFDDSTSFILPKFMSPLGSDKNTFISNIPDNGSRWQRPILLSTERILHYLRTGNRAPLQEYHSFRSSSRQFDPRTNFTKAKANDGEPAKYESESNQLQQLLDTGVRGLVVEVNHYASQVMDLKNTPALENFSTFSEAIKNPREHINGAMLHNVEEMRTRAIHAISSMAENTQNAAADTFADGLLHTTSLLDTIGHHISPHNDRKTWDRLRDNHSAPITAGLIIGTAAEDVSRSIKAAFEDSVQLAKSSIENTKEEWQQKFYETLMAGWDKAVANIQIEYEATVKIRDRRDVQDVSNTQVTAGMKAGNQEHRVIRVGALAPGGDVNREELKKTAHEHVKRTLDSLAAVKKGFEEITSKTFDTFWVQDTKLQITKDLQHGAESVNVPLGEGITRSGTSEIGVVVTSESGQVEILNPAVVGLGPNTLGQTVDFGLGQGHEWLSYINSPTESNSNQPGQDIKVTSQSWLGNIVGSIRTPFDSASILENMAKATQSQVADIKAEPQKPKKA